MNLPIDEWKTTCQICGKTRMFKEVDVKKIDRTEEFGIQVIQNVSYCNDNPDCIAKAQAMTAEDLVKKEKKIE